MRKTFNTVNESKYFKIAMHYLANSAALFVPHLSKLRLLSLQVFHLSFNVTHTPVCVTLVLITQAQLLHLKLQLYSNSV
jgi:hypothetical protein